MRLFEQMPKKYGYCAYCGNVRNLTVDHVVPKSCTKQIIGNKLLVCSWCNTNKWIYSLHTWLLKTPMEYPQHISRRFLCFTLDMIEEYYQLQRKTASTTRKKDLIK